ncbi:hypothetical protein BC943DRAFT_82305 [Umbelopsis sp. AD052]|nr:hypothetical protein BC943DRAFT_82305 [Umbelopsis sp. AD052]
MSRVEHTYRDIYPSSVIFFSITCKLCKRSLSIVIIGINWCGFRASSRAVRACIWIRQIKVNTLLSDETLLKKIGRSHSQSNNQIVEHTSLAEPRRMHCTASFSGESSSRVSKSSRKKLKKGFCSKVSGPYRMHKTKSMANRRCSNLSVKVRQVRSLLLRSVIRQTGD